MKEYFIIVFSRGKLQEYALKNRGSS